MSNSDIETKHFFCQPHGVIFPKKVEITKRVADTAPPTDTRATTFWSVKLNFAGLIAKRVTEQRDYRGDALKDQSVKNLVSTVIRKLKCENRVQVALALINTSVAT